MDLLRDGDMLAFRIAPTQRIQPKSKQPTFTSRLIFQRARHLLGNRSRPVVGVDGVAEEVGDAVVEASDATSSASNIAPMSSPRTASLKAGTTNTILTPPNQTTAINKTTKAMVINKTMGHKTIMNHHNHALEIFPSSALDLVLFLQWAKNSSFQVEAFWKTNLGI